MINNPNGITNHPVVSHDEWLSARKAFLAEEKASILKGKRLSVMNTQDYHKSITTTVSAEEAFQKISSPSTWWTANIKGSAKNLNDVFTMWVGERTTVTLQVVEVVPHKKWVWLVTDCQLLWLKDTTEWKNTQIVFEISEEKHQTSIDMTHVGIVPGVECYNVCEDAWNGHLNNLAVWLETGISPLT